MVTPEELDALTLTTTRWREGYRRSEVDAFLVRVREALAGTGDLAPAEVVEQRFNPSRFTTGYDQDEVDDLLDRVVATLRLRPEHQPRGRRTGTPALSADALAARRPRTVQLREGYDRVQVDAFLARAVEALRAAELDRPHDMRSFDVSRVRFDPSGLRGGYDQDETDDLLDEVGQSLAAWGR